MLFSLSVFISLFQSSNPGNVFDWLAISSNGSLFQSSSDLLFSWFLFISCSKSSNPDNIVDWVSFSSNVSLFKSTNPGINSVLLLESSIKLLLPWLLFIILLFCLVLSVEPILSSSGILSKSFTPGIIWCFSSSSSGIGFLRGLPLLPFGFGGSIGYLRGLPLPRLDSCIISLFVSTNCLSVFILFSLLLSCNCDSEIEIFGILLTAIFAFSSLILKSEAVLFCIPLNIPVLSSKSSIPISFVFDSLSNLSLASPKLLNPETSIFSLFIVCTGSFSVAIGFLLFILSSFLLEDNVLFALLFDISSNSSSV